MQEIYTNTVNYEDFVVWLKGYFERYWDSRFMAYMQGQSTIGGLSRSKTENFLRVSLPTKPTALSVDEFLTTDLPSDRKFTLSATYDNGSRLSITFDPVIDTESTILVSGVSLDEFFVQDLKDNLAFNFGTSELHQENVLLLENRGKASQPKGAPTDKASSSDDSVAELSWQTNPGVQVKIHTQTITGINVKIFCRRFEHYITDKMAQVFSGGENNLLTGATIEQNMLRQDVEMDFLFFLNVESPSPNTRLMLGTMHVTEHRVNVINVFVQAHHPGAWFDDLILWVDGLAQENDKVVFEQPNILTEKPPSPDSLSGSLIKLQRGRKRRPDYNEAYHALYIQQNYQDKRKAFESFVLPQMGDLDAAQEEDAYDAFVSAMYRRRKTDEKPTKLTSEKRL